MSSQLKINPRVTRLIHIIEMIDKGEIKVPSFQRAYIWEKNQRIDLFESIKNEYPIGAVLLWKPDNENKFTIKKEIGPYNVDSTDAGGYFYIMDGFQRLSTLFGCLTNPQKTTHEIIEDKQKDFAIHYDLVNEEFNIPRGQPNITNIPVYILSDIFEYLDFAEKLRSQIPDRDEANMLIERGKQLSSTIIDYQIPYIEIHGGAIEQAVNIFSKVNSKGTPVSKDWMVSALTTDHSQNFNLGDQIDELLVKLQPFNFDDLKREIVLQCIQSSFGQYYIDVTIEDLIKKQDFVAKAENTIQSLEIAVKFLFEELLVLERRLLPYNNQLIFMTYFFSKVNQNAEQYGTQLEKLKQWFWVTTYSNYFSIYSPSKKRTAFKHFGKFIEDANINPVFNDNPRIPFSVLDFPQTTYFGSVRSSALVLFLLNHSNEFEDINADEVEGMTLHFLNNFFMGDEFITIPDGKTPDKLIATIDYINATGNFIQEKYIDLENIIQSKDDLELKKYFLSKEMSGNKPKEILNSRGILIKAAEEQFFTQFGLRYEHNETIQ